MSSQTRYLHLYTPGHAVPIALLEYQQSPGSKRLRNIRWLKDRLHLEETMLLGQTIKERGIYGYALKVRDPASLPRNTHRNIVSEYAPVRVTTDELVGYLGGLP